VSQKKPPQKIAMPRLAPDMELACGYRLREELGKGGFATVWEAEHKSGRRSALKFIPCRRDLSAAKELRAIQAISRLGCPNLVEVEQVYSDVGCIIVVMELADGSLLDLLGRYQEEAQAPVLPELVCIYLAQAAEALDFLNAHRHEVQGTLSGFQHCDVKPSNLLLFDDVVKLSDFGLSSASGATIRLHRRAGTPAYAAPEVFQSRISDWTDQYALAISYCQLRGGRMPFTDTPSFRREYVRPTPDLTMLPETEQPIIARALSHTPQNRWPTCTELVRRLAAAIAAPDAASTAIPSPSRRSRPTK
jgi:serine/threonine protein kinase